MIDVKKERVYAFCRLVDALPRRRRGRKTNISTLYRWSTIGCRGVILESIQVGGTRCTSLEALQRFFEKLSVPVQARTNFGPQAGHRTLAQRQRASEAAGRKLAEQGA
jgi:hypothetical protein